MIYEISSETLSGAVAQLVTIMKAQNSPKHRIDTARFVTNEGSVVTIDLRGKSKKPPRKIGDKKTVKGATYVCRQVTHDGCYVVNRGKPVLHWVAADGSEL